MSRRVAITIADCCHRDDGNPESVCEVIKVHWWCSAICSERSTRPHSENLKMQQVLPFKRSHSESKINDCGSHKNTKHEIRPLFKFSFNSEFYVGLRLVLHA